MNERAAELFALANAEVKSIERKTRTLKQIIARAQDALSTAENDVQTEEVTTNERSYPGYAGTD